MTEKRFIFHGTNIEDTLEPIKEDKYTLCNKDGFEDLCCMLNELHEENQQLRLENAELKSANKGLHKERENLYKRLEDLEW